MTVVVARRNDVDVWVTGIPQTLVGIQFRGVFGKTPAELTELALGTAEGFKSAFGCELSEDCLLAQDDVLLVGVSPACQNLGLPVGKPFRAWLQTMTRELSSCLLVREPLCADCGADGGATLPARADGALLRGLFRGQSRPLQEAGGDSR